MDVAGVVGVEAEALDPELRTDAVLAREAPHGAGVLPHHRLRGRSEGLPVGIGAERVQPGKPRHRGPVADAVRPLGQRKEADRGARALTVDVRHEVRDQLDQAALAEGEDLGSEARGHGLAEALEEQRLAAVAATAPALGAEPELLRLDPVRLVTEDAVGAGVDRGVDPRADEAADALVVEAAGRGRAAVVEHLAHLRMRGPRRRRRGRPPRERSAPPGPRRATSRRCLASSRGRRRGRSR